jgi:hypothetical protein
MYVSLAAELSHPLLRQSPIEPDNPRSARTVRTVGNPTLLPGHQHLNAFILQGDTSHE